VSADPRGNVRYAGALPVTYENFAPLGLWVVMPRVPQPVRDEIFAKGLVGPVPLSAPLPGDAYKSSITLDAQDMTTSRLRFKVHLGHAGSGAPWPGSFSALQPKHVGVVRMLVSLGGADGEEIDTAGCAVPRTMFPGDVVDVDCNVHLARGAVAPGPYTLRVGLVQQGVAVFSDRGDDVGTLPITIGR
jgi:hypothetical protein